MASTPETSDFTSIKLRIESAKEGTNPDTLAGFQDSERKDKADGIPFALQDYIELVEEPGRAGRQSYPRRQTWPIDNNFPPILKRLNIDTETWLYIATTFEDSLSGAA